MGSPAPVPPPVAPGRRVARGEGKRPDPTSTAEQPRTGPETEPFTQAVSSEPTVLSVELRLPPGADRSGLGELVAVTTGAPLSIREVRRTIERLFRTGRFADIVVRARDVEAPPPGTGPSGVRLVFELTPKLAIVQLSVDGAHVLTAPEVLEAAKLAQGDEYYPERIDAAQAGIVQAYARRGYDQAQVQVEVTEAAKGVDVLFNLVEGPPTQVGSLVVAGHPGLALGRITQALGVELGTTLDLKVLSQGLERLRALYRQERFYRARVGEPVIDRRGGVAQVLLPIAAGPQYTLHFHDNRSFPDAVLRQVVHYDGSETLDPAVIGRLTRRVEGYYRQQGFHDVRVRAEEVRSADGAQAILSFVVDEGFPVFVASIDFTGNSRISTAELEKVVEGYVKQRAGTQEVAVPVDDPLDLEGRIEHHGAALVPVTEPKRVLLEDAYRDAALGITALYRERGYRQARAEFAGAEVDVPNHRAFARFVLSEGPRAVVREVSFRGFPAGFDPRALPEGLGTGGPLSDGAVEAARTALGRALAHRGYLFGKVDAEQALSADGRSAAVAFVAEAGPQVHVGQVIVQGLTRTDERMVRAYLKIRPGQVLDPDDLFETQRSLVVLGIFRQVAVKLIAPETPERQKDVVVELRERPRLSGEISGGYYLVDGPRVIFDASYPNVAGQGINLSGRLKVNYAGASGPGLAGNLNETGFAALGGRGNLSVQQPRLYNLLPVEIGVRMDLVGERTFRPAYTFSRVAAIPGIDWTVTRWFGINLQYELELDDVRPGKNIDTLSDSLTRTDIERLRFPAGRFTLQTLRPTFTVDFRDDAANPTSGVLMTLVSEYSHDLSTELAVTHAAFPVNMLKVSGAVTVYLPVIPRVVLALSGRGGRIYSFDENQNILGPKRFFLGGSNSFRGFRDDGLIAEDSRTDLHRQVASCRALLVPSTIGCTNAAATVLAGKELPSEGGTLFVLGKAELRFPLFSSVEMGVFGELGNLWLDPFAYDLAVLRYVAGAGIRLGTPIGPLAFDLGINLSPDALINEQPVILNFSIGLF